MTVLSIPCHREDNCINRLFLGGLLFLRGHPVTGLVVFDLNINMECRLTPIATGHTCSRFVNHVYHVMERYALYIGDIGMIPRFSVLLLRFVNIIHCQKVRKASRCIGI